MKNFKRFLTPIVISTVLAGMSCKKDSTPDLNQPLFDQMKSVTDSIIQNTHVPGIVALVVDHKRRIDWLYTAGVSDITNKLPMDGNFTFRIGSNTKTMTGTVLLQLVDEGKLKLSDKLSKYFPEYSKSDSITLTMLCNMTTGIFNYTNDESFWTNLYASPLKVWQPKELVAIGFSHDFVFQPGKGWQYSNTNSILLGMIIEKVTGNTIQAEIENRIMKHLNLTHSGFLTSGPGLPGSHARGYYSGEYVDGEDMTENIDVSWAWAAGSVYSTPRELQKYSERLVGGGFLSDSLQNRRLTAMQNIIPGLDYGLCLAKKGSFYGHNGGMPGFTSTMYHSNDKNCTIIIYFNSDIESPDPIVPDMLLARFFNILYGNNY